MFIVEQEHGHDGADADARQHEERAIHHARYGPPLLSDDVIALALLGARDRAAYVLQNLLDVVALGVRASAWR